MSKVRMFVDVFAQYRKHHSFGYAVRRAWHIAIQGADF